MKWIKNGNQLINMSHVSCIKIAGEKQNEIVFYYNESTRMLKLAYKTEERAEKELEAIAQFLEYQPAVIMAMAPTQEE